jgi:hypothetical protein
MLLSRGKPGIFQIYFETPAALARIANPGPVMTSVQIYTAIFSVLFVVRIDQHCPLPPAVSRDPSSHVL